MSDQDPPIPREDTEPDEKAPTPPKSPSGEKVPSRKGSAPIPPKPALRKASAPLPPSDTKGPGPDLSVRRASGIEVVHNLVQGRVDSYGQIKYDKTAPVPTNELKEPPPKFEKDFWLCTGMLLVLFVVCIIGFIVLWKVGKDVFPKDYIESKVDTEVGFTKFHPIILFENVTRAVTNTTGPDASSDATSEISPTGPESTTISSETPSTETTPPAPPGE